MKGKDFSSKEKETCAKKGYKSRNNTKNRGRDKRSKPTQDVERNVDQLKGFNDFSWYNKNPVLLESAARIPFAVPTGGELDAGTLYWKDSGTTKLVPGSLRTSGVMAVDYSPAIGYSQSADSPATIAAREIYAKVRKAYSGTLSVDAPDFMMYLLALDGIFSYIARLKRIYRTINVYSGVNKYTPDVLLGVNLGFTYGADAKCQAALNDLRTNKTRLWGGINTLIHNVSKFTCPAVMDIFNRHYWMNDNYFMDRPNRKAQIYMFRQSSFWKFKLDEQSRGCVTCEPLAANSTSMGMVDYLLKFGNDLLNALNDDEDAYTINGYLQRAFEGTPSFKIDVLGEDEIAEFIYSPEVLYQIHNAKVIPSNSLILPTVTQTGTDSTVVSTPSFIIPLDKDGVGRALPNTILDVDAELPDMPSVVVSSRLMYAYEVLNQDANQYVVAIYCGTEIVNLFNMATFDGFTWTTKAFKNNLLVKANITEDDLQKMARWSMFNLAPVVTYWYIDAASSTFKPITLGDMTNPTSVNNEALKDLNQ